MATKQLTRNVAIGGVVYGPAGQPGVVSDVPADVLKQITNPRAFEEVNEPTPAERIEAAEKALAEAREAARREAEDASPAKRPRPAKPSTSSGDGGDAK